MCVEMDTWIESLSHLVRLQVNELYLIYTHAYIGDNFIHTLLTPLVTTFFFLWIDVLSLVGFHLFRILLLFDKIKLNKNQIKTNVLKIYHLFFQMFTFFNHL